MQEPGQLPPPWLRQVDDTTWRLYIYVQPGAKKSEVAGEMEGRLRLRIAAQAVDNKANKAVLDFVAKRLGLRASRCSIENGETSRKKTLMLCNVTGCDWSALTASAVSS